MKKNFLLFGVAVFGAASAQQKDVFDVNKHIRVLLNKKKSTFLKANSFQLYKNSGSTAKLSFTLSNGDKVYILPVDNMPCVVPGYKQHDMPNISNPNIYYNTPLFRNDTQGSIPNAVKPYRLISSK